MQNLFRHKHPKGLYLLFFVEMWERFSYYGFRALLVLYMVQSLMYSTQKAGNIYGMYTGLVYLTPLIGGYIADRYLGQRRCITAGAILFSLGLFLLTFCPKNIFFFSLFLMVCANGFFKSNISSLLGLLYDGNNKKKDSAFTIFYMGINIGAFFAPLICATLAFKYGFEWGFATAGTGMLIGLILYKIYENKLFGNIGLNPIILKKDNNNISVSNQDKSRIYSLIFLMIFTIPFWICFEQAGSSLTLFAEYEVERNFFGHTIPTGYFQALNPFFIILLAPIMSGFWDVLNTKSKEPDSIQKFAIALLLMTVACLITACAGYFTETSKVSPLWLVAIYFIMTVSELCISPIGLSLVSKLAPKKFLSLTMGCWFFACFLGDFLAGYWGGKYENMTILEIFIPLAILSFISFLILLILMPKLSKALNNESK